jgi:Uma2 family endonuclease
MAGSDPMAPSARPESDTRLTYDNLFDFPDDGKRRELIDGELFVTPSPNLRHQELIGRLHIAIATYLASRPGRGRVFLSPLDVVFSRYDVVEPDLLFVAGDQLEILTPANVQGSPALVVEILSPGTRKRDEQTKRRLFSRNVVREYWIVDPESDLIKVSRRAADGSFPRVVELSAEDGDELTSPLLPEFSLALSEFFAPTT